MRWSTSCKITTSTRRLRRVLVSLLVSRSWTRFLQPSGSMALSNQSRARITASGRHPLALKVGYFERAGSGAVAFISGSHQKPGSGFLEPPIALGAALDSDGGTCAPRAGSRVCDSRAYSRVCDSRGCGLACLRLARGLVLLRLAGVLACLRLARLRVACVRPACVRPACLRLTRLRGALHGESFHRAMLYRSSDAF